MDRTLRKRTCTQMLLELTKGWRVIELAEVYRRRGRGGMGIVDRRNMQQIVIRLQRSQKLDLNNKVI